MGGRHDDDDIASSDTHAQEPLASTSLTRRARAIRPGDTLGPNGRYEIGEELGEGGMATVFRARDTQLRRDVAIKVLFPHLAKRDEIVRRFQREARAAAGLEHPNVLRIYDVGGAEGEDPPYIVMEIIRGRSLLQEIEQRGAMFAEVAACVGALLADALAAAHAAAIVHRDIKPANVMIASNGRVLLTDFGVARLETEDSLVTKTGALLGTPAYMSPEQASGDTATAKSDVYSLGATLYQLATGTLPYTGSPAKVLAQIAAGTLLAPVKKKPGVGPDLSRSIERMMQTEPEQRTASTAAVAAELRSLATAAGFGDPADELAAYFTDPAAFLAQKTPAVLAATLSAANAALASGALPRALALTDRASVLAPDEPAVTALLERVAAGGRASSRRRTLGFAALGIAVAAGGALGVRALLVDDSPATADAPVDAAPDAAPDALADAAPDAADAASDAAVDAAPLDARPLLVDAAVRADAVLARRDAASDPVAIVVDAAPAPIDAPPVVTATTGTLIVSSSVWCDVFVDDVRRGQFSAGKPLRVELPLGSHTVRCSQPTVAGYTWTQVVDVGPGEQKVHGKVDTSIEITLAVATTIDGAPYPAGAKVRVQRGQVKVGDRYVQISVPCTVRADGNCYR